MDTVYMDYCAKFEFQIKFSEEHHVERQSKLVSLYIRGHQALVPKIVCKQNSSQIAMG